MAGMPKNDRILAGEVRDLTLREIKRILTGTDEDYKKQLILKLSSSILPRVNEHSGIDGEAIQTSIVYLPAKPNDTSLET